jgi:hypothetical protein
MHMVYVRIFKMNSVCKTVHTMQSHVAEHRSSKFDIYAMGYFNRTVYAVPDSQCTQSLLEQAQLLSLAAYVNAIENPRL